MELTIKQNEGGPVCACAAGRITQSNFGSPDSDPLSDLLGDDVYSRDVVLDLQGTDFMDSSGVNWLIRSHRRFTENGRRMVLHSVPPVVRNVIRVMRLDQLLEIAENEAAALRKIHEEPS